MNAADSENTGTGGGLRYITEESSTDVVNQEHSHSCQAACARQLLSDAGVSISEDELLAAIGYIEDYGTTAEHTAPVLSGLHPRLGYGGGTVSREDVAILFRRDPWIASLRTYHGTVHAVIVDALEGTIVHVRDPWGLSGPGSGSGSKATMQLTDFLEHWHWSMNKAVFPNRRK
jgi:predicted double-glycine peptidase